MRLTKWGAEQARITGRWLLGQFPDGFDSYQVSSYIRARETAGYLALGGAWRIEGRWGERNWGEFSGLTEAERQRKYEASCKLREQHAWYWCPPGGQSLSMAHADTKGIFNTLHRKSADRRVVVVTHAERIDVVRYDLEHMNPESWLADRANPSRRLENAMVLHYTRQDPSTGEIADHLSWVRGVCPWDPDKSWDGGGWVAVPPRPTYSDAELLASVEPYPRLLDD